jgi:hypothetical protein
MPGWAVKSNSSSVLVEGPGEPHPAGEAALLGRVDLDGEQVVQELRVAGLVLRGLFERSGKMLGDGGELEVGQMRAEVLVGGVLVHL